MCVAQQVELRVCERIWVMARAELGQTAGLTHSSRKRSEGDKLTSSPVLEREDKGLFPNVATEAGASREDALNCCSLSPLPGKIIDGAECPEKQKAD